MINLQDHKQLRENWQEYCKEFGAEVDYQDYLEYLILHRTTLWKEAENTLALIEKFLSEYEGEYASIWKDGNRWAAETSGDKNNAYHNGDTIQEAIESFYAAQKEAKSES